MQQHRERVAKTGAIGAKFRCFSCDYERYSQEVRVMEDTRNISFAPHYAIRRFFASGESPLQPAAQFNIAQPGILRNILAY
jgi:hypothetical protein